MPLVSIIIPTFNRERCLGRAIDCALEQTFRDSEVIVVDDGSTDGTARLLERYAGRIRVERQTNQGPAAARNVGLRMANGDLVAFLDSDDWWPPCKLERQVPLMNDDRVVLSATNWRRAGETGGTEFDALGFRGTLRLDRPYLHIARPGGHRLLLSTWLVRKSAVLKIGGFDPTFRIAQDNHLVFRLAFEGAFALTSEVLLEFSNVDDAVRQTRRGNFDYERTVNRYMLRAWSEARLLAMGREREAQRRLDRALGVSLTREAQFCAWEGEYPAARRLAAEALILGVDGRSRWKALGICFFPGVLGHRLRRRYGPPRTAHET